MATEDQILLKLIITGMDPSEVARLAQMTGGELTAQMRVHIDRLTQLHRDANQAQTAEAVKRVRTEIDEEEKVIDQMSKVGRAHEIAANRASGAWHRTMEDLENITTVARGAFDVIMGGFERFKQLAESISDVTNVYGALTGSIEEMRKATEGEVSDYDLILVKNRAQQKELKLTDEQMGIVSARALDYAHALHVPVKEAMEELINGLATGRVRTLAQAGVMITAAEAATEYEKAHHKAAGSLTEHEQRLAVLELALRRSDELLAASKGHAETFAQSWEKVSTQFTNGWHLALIEIGKFINGAVKGLTVELPEAVRMGIAKVEDLVTFGRAGAVNRANDAHNQRIQTELAAENAAATEAQKRLDSGSAYNVGDNAVGGDRTRKATSKPKDLNSSFDMLDRMFAAGNQEAPPEPESLLPFPSLGLKEDSAEEWAKRTEKSREEVAKYLELEKKQADEMTKLVEEDVRKRQERKDSVKGTGLIGQLVWAPGGPDQAYKDMDEFGRGMVDAMSKMNSELGGAVQAMSNAIGQSIAASMAGSDAHRKHVRTVAHDVLESLAAQSIGQAVFQTAMGLADLALAALGDPLAGASAALHFASAAAFGTVGAVAAVGARSIGTSSADSAAAGSARSSGGLANSKTNSFGGSSSSSSGTQTQSAPVTINMTVLPGGEPEAGRAVMKALNALHQQTGNTGIGNLVNAA